MNTLLLRLAAPLQAWGTSSKYDIRRTETEPSKSGVIGLLAAALGRRRDEPLDDLCALRMGIRVDQSGEVQQDFQIARPEKGASYVTHRYYLFDAVFLVGLESGDEVLLQKLDEALKNPVFPLFLGRRSCPPTLPLTLGVREKELMSALRQEPWLAAAWRQPKLSNELRLLSDGTSDDLDSWMQKDVPQSFHPRHRKYATRIIAERGQVNCKGSFMETTHDAMMELES